MVAAQQQVIVHTTVLQHWWRQARREHRLALRLLRETPENLALLSRLEVIISKIDSSHVSMLRSQYPNAVRETRSFLLSAEHNFIECLRAIRANNMHEAVKFYNNAHNDLSLLQYNFMEKGIDAQL